MAQTLSDQLDAILSEFERNVPHVEATAVVSTDGLVIASRLPDQVEEDPELICLRGVVARHALHDGIVCEEDDVVAARLDTESDVGCLRAGHMD